MKEVYLVTGSEYKISEFNRLFPENFLAGYRAITADEIQSTYTEEITEAKARQAFDIVGAPVIVEDISAGLEELGWLPGPFIKFFEKKLGDHALLKLVKENDRARISSTLCYFDGKLPIFSHGSIDGRMVEPRQGIGYGYDFSFLPDGQGKTYSEMSPAEKDAISERSIAVRGLVNKLTS